MLERLHGKTTLVTGATMIHRPPGLTVSIEPGALHTRRCHPACPAARRLTLTTGTLDPTPAHPLTYGLTL